MQVAPTVGYDWEQAEQVERLHPGGKRESPRVRLSRPTTLQATRRGRTDARRICMNKKQLTTRPPQLWDPWSICWPLESNTFFIV